jgi:hypothetical protein
MQNIYRTVIPVSLSSLEQVRNESLLEKIFGVSYCFLYQISGFSGVAFTFKNCLGTFIF